MAISLHLNGFSLLKPPCASREVNLQGIFSNVYKWKLSIIGCQFICVVVATDVMPYNNNSKATAERSLISAQLYLIRLQWELLMNPLLLISAILFTNIYESLLFTVNQFLLNVRWGVTYFQRTTNISSQRPFIIIF